jgi:hypothetical protein
LPTIFAGGIHIVHPPPTFFLPKNCPEKTHSGGAETAHLKRPFKLPSQKKLKNLPYGGLNLGGFYEKNLGSAGHAGAGIRKRGGA